MPGEYPSAPAGAGEGRTPVFRTGNQTRPLAGRGIRLLVGLCPLFLSFAGCGFWDDFRANDYSVKAYFKKEDPLTVVQETTDSSKQARYLGKIEEPLQHGGNAAKQDAAIQELNKAATTHPQAWSRVQALKSLSEFKDPRAPQIVIDAYYKAEPFSAEHRSYIRIQAINALGKLGDKAGVDLLVRIVQAPPVETTANSDQDQRTYLDERMAAARALQNFKDYRATEALVEVLRTDKDIGLRERATESLQTVTGKKLPSDYAAWDQVLHPSGNQNSIANQQQQRPIIQAGMRQQ